MATFSCRCRAVGRPGCRNRRPNSGRQTLDDIFINTLTASIALAIPAMQTIKSRDTYSSILHIVFPLGERYGKSLEEVGVERRTYVAAGLVGQTHIL